MVFYKLAIDSILIKSLLFYIYYELDEPKLPLLNQMHLFLFAFSRSQVATLNALLVQP